MLNIITIVFYSIWEFRVLENMFPLKKNEYFHAQYL